jgi:CheY-like chemotaxis protein
MDESNQYVILLVNGDPFGESPIDVALRGRGLTLRYAASGPEAVALARASLPDLVLLDLGADGHAACEELKADPRTSEVPVILVSPCGARSERARVFELGGADCIAKPFAEAELVARVRFQLDLARLQRGVAFRREQAPWRGDERPGTRAEGSRGVAAAGARARRGETLDRRYRLMEVIGAGGSCTVFRALDLAGGHDVAVKIQDPEAALLAPGVAGERLGRGSLRAVAHSGAVQVRDRGMTEDGLPYLVMEFLVGQPLRRELVLRRTLSVERCAQIVIPVCDVLSAAHAAGIVHRDIKPDNIFLHQGTTGEQVKVIDFDLAAPVGGLGVGAMERGVVAGTPEYAAPELFAAGGHDGRADVYSLGITLYEMLCGRLPFRSTSRDPGALATMHLCEPPPPPRRLNPDIPAEVEEVVLHALAKDPEHRPRAAELGVHLLRVMPAEGGVTRARPGCG